MEKKGPRRELGYPLAVVRYYGPDERTAAKMEVRVLPSAGAPPSAVKTWLSDGEDVRQDEAVQSDWMAFLAEQEVAKVMILDRIALLDTGEEAG